MTGRIHYNAHFTPGEIMNMVIPSSIREIPAGQAVDDTVVVHSRPAISMSLLGEFKVERAGEPCQLPPSRKTRALLAYLAVTGKPQRRERLCELFWDIPDDPRGSLRWSLSKIRSIFRVDALDGLLETDRNSVALRTSRQRRNRPA
jgi:hypothetical protein